MQRILIFLISFCFFVACNNEDGQPTPEVGDTPGVSKIPGSWSPYWSHLFHDGKPVQSEHFIVYSEASAQAFREQTAEAAEQAFIDIKSIFEVSHDDFDFLPDWGSEKIHILTDYNQWNRSGLAYRDGLIMRAKDSPRFDGNHVRWQLVLQHEITHVVEFLLIGDFNYRLANSVWFREGIANYGARNHAIQTVEELEAWKQTTRALPGAGNPIEIEVWNDFPQEIIDNNRTLEYYQFFELSVRYLLDEEHGHGTNMEDAKLFYEHLGQGRVFEQAFQTNFGISVQSFRSQWWGLMEAYLQRIEEE